MKKKIKKLAIIESVVNVLSGLVLSIIIIQPLAFWIFDVETTFAQNIGLAIFFTVVSIIRGYIWRLYFHKRFYSE